MRLNNLRDEGRAIGDALALLAGAALPFAFAPFGLFPLAILSQALLYFCWCNATPARALWRGWLYGVGQFGIGVSWVQVSIHQFGLPILAFSVSVTVVLVLFLALYPALVGWVAIRWFNAPSRWLILGVMPALWTLGEWVRGWLFTGFPWLNLGYSQIDSPLAAYAPVAGVYGVSLAVAVSAGALVLLFAERLRPLIVLAMIWAIAVALSLLQWSMPTTVPLKVALIQGGIEQSLKWDPALRDQTLDHYMRLTQPYWGSDIVIWPETAIPAFGSEVKGFLAGLDERAVKSDTDMLLGIAIDERDESGRLTDYYNSIISLGRAVGRYDKRHLVPLGEYPPLEPILMPLLRLLSIPMSDFTAGRHEQPRLQAAGLRIGGSVCYEDAFGEEVIDSLPEAQLLVNVSNDAWFGDSLAPHQHLEIARMRALETARYLLRATNNGISAIIDPRGKVAARSPQFSPYALSGEIRGHDGATPYARVGNWPVVMLLLAMLALSRAAGERR
ncbi:MAG: apolipoprotein N-acyltransferase [Chromatiales bacterium]